MSYVTGELIKELREKNKMTQKELAALIMVSDKTVSKWETGKGLPDIGIIDDLAHALKISAADLLTGEYRENENVSANMKKIHFYVCPVCGNVITSVGAGSFSCCGIKLLEQEIECGESTDQSDIINSKDNADQGGILNHWISVETADDDYFVRITHEMSKKHYISFVSYITSDDVEIRKLYPEQEIEVNFRRRGHGVICAYCNRHGMFGIRV